MPTGHNENAAACFAADILAEGTVAIPNILLQYYYQLGLSDSQLVLLLQILRCSGLNREKMPTMEQLAECSGKSAAQIEETIQYLIAKDYLESKEIYIADKLCLSKVYSLAPLYDKLSELWAQLRIADIRKVEQLKSKQTELQSKIFSPLLGRLAKIFEKEFARPLSPIEFEQIGNWLELSYSEELIKEALRRAVLMGKHNFKYIDRILLDWQKNNIQTVQQVEQYENDFRKRQTAGGKYAAAGGSDRPPSRSQNNSQNGGQNKAQTNREEEQRKMELIRSLYVN